MVIRVETFEIDGHTYEIAMFPPKKGFKLGMKVARIAGPIVSKLSGAANPQDLMNLNLSDNSFVEAMELLRDKWDEKLEDELIRELATVTSMDGIPLQGIFDAHFSGRLFAMSKWLVLGLKAQFADFFDLWGTVTAPEDL